MSSGSTPSPNNNATPQKIQVMSNSQEPVEKKERSLLTEAVQFVDNISIIPPEVEKGNVEYKLKLVNPSSERFQHLVTQLKWRLSEGQGEAIYELGVSDHGILIGMTDMEFQHSLATLKRMAEYLQAEISVVRERVISGRARLLSREMRQRRESLRQETLPRSRKSSTCSSHNTQSSPLRDSPVSISFSGEFGEAGSADSIAGSEDLDCANLTFEQLANSKFIIGDEEEGPDINNGQQQEFKCAEVMIRKTNNDDHFIEIRIAFLGGANAGKSTLLGYLSHGELDNGYGKARLNLLRHRHEIETGRSSSISHSIIGFSSTGRLLNYASTSSHLSQSTETDEVERRQSIADINTLLSPNSDLSAGDHVADVNSSLVDRYIVEDAAKIVMLLDTCGHPKYIHTTLSSLTGYEPDYACIVVDGSAGSVDATTKELLGCALVLHVPVFVVVTKIDLCQKSNDERSKLKSTLESLVHLLMLPGSSRIALVVKNDDDAIVSVQPFVEGNAIPIFLVSSVTSENVDLLTKFMNLLPSRGACVSERGISKSAQGSRSKSVEFHVEEVYEVPKVGVVVGGRLMAGELARGNYWTFKDNERDRVKQLWIGPLENGEFRKVSLTSVHRQRRPVSLVKAGQTASLAIEGFAKEHIRKGMVLLGQTEQPKATREFEANMMVLFAPSSVKFDIYDPSKYEVSTVLSDASATPRSRKRKSLPSFSGTANQDGTKEFKVHWGMTHIANVRQPVQILGAIPDSLLDDRSSRSISSGSRIRLRLRFFKSAEWITAGMRLLYREEGAAPNSRHSDRRTEKVPKRSQGMRMVGEVTKIFNEIAHDAAF